MENKEKDIKELNSEARELSLEELEQVVGGARRKKDYKLRSGDGNDEKKGGQIVKPNKFVQA